MIKLIALDLDGSALDNQGELVPENIRAVKEAMAAGVQVVVITGRMFASARRHAQTLGVKLPMIAYQGAHLRDVQTGEVLFSTHLSGVMASDIVSLCDVNGLYPQTYVDDELCVSSTNPYVESYAKYSGVPIKAVGNLAHWLLENDDICLGGVPKVLAIADEAKINKLWPIFANFYGKQVYITRSASGFLEFISPKANKGVALRALADSLDIKQEEIMACGDNHNDLPLLQAAGLKIAMGNATQKLKDIADFVALSNEQAGVAQAIDKFVLNK